MNTDPFEQTNIALKSAAALVDQSRDEIARLAKERDQLKQQLAQLRQEYDRYTEQQTDLTQREHKRHVEIKERLEQQLAQAQAACAELRDYATMVVGNYMAGHNDELLEFIRTTNILRRDNDCGKGWLSPDEAKRLEADAACLRQLVQRYGSMGPTQSECEQALSTTAGRSLLERLESLRKLLFYVAYHRLPLSDTTLFDDLDLERQKQIHKALEGDKQ